MDGMKLNLDINGNVEYIVCFYLSVLFLFLWGNPCVEIKNRDEPDPIFSGPGRTGAGLDFRGSHRTGPRRSAGPRTGPDPGQITLKCPITNSNSLKNKIGSAIQSYALKIVSCYLRCANFRTPFPQYSKCKKAWVGLRGI